MDKYWQDNFFGKCHTLALNNVKRRVAIHYHLFKNAGSSVDHILATNFGERWSTLEGEYPWSVIRANDISDFIRRNPKLLAVSSHTARLPLPQLPSITFYPILFLRHPIDRVGSVYHFERKQPGNGFSAITARENGFAGYVQQMLDNHDNEGIVISNFQTICLSNAAAELTDLRKATVDRFRLLEANAFLTDIPTFGLVEHFSLSALRFGNWLKTPFPGINFFSIKTNSQPQRGKRIEERLQEIERELGSSLFKKLIDANEYDLQLYHYAHDLFVNQASLPTC